MQNKLILAVGILVIAVGMIAVYFYFSRESSPKDAATPDTQTIFPVADTGSAGSGPDRGAPELPAGDTPVSVSSRLAQISAGPIVPGEAVTNIKAKNASSSPEIAVTYIARENGNVFTYLGSSKTLTRINNKTIPGVQSATWLPDASVAFVRYLSGADSSTINTYALSATSSSGFFLPQDLSDLAVASDKILTLSSGINGSIGALARIDGSRSTTVFTSALTALHVSFAGKNQYFAFSKPSATLPGSAFLIDNAGHFSRVAGPLNGLTALVSPGGKWVLVSSSLRGTLQTALVNTATRVSSALPVSTIADKCVWSADESSVYCGIPTNVPSSFLYPDDWYQGAVHFSDKIWKIDVAGRYTQMILDFPSVHKEDLDATALAIDPLSTTLVFLNKNDGSLWSYSL